MNRLQDLRTAAGLTQESLARKAGLSLSGLRQLETGRRMPRFTTAQAVADALGVAADAIWTPDDAPAA